MAEAASPWLQRRQSRLAPHQLSPDNHNFSRSPKPLEACRPSQSHRSGILKTIRSFKRPLEVFKGQIVEIALEPFQSNTYSELIYVQHWQTHETSCAHAAANGTSASGLATRTVEGHQRRRCGQVVAQVSDGSIGARSKNDPRRSIQPTPSFLEDMVLTATTRLSRRQKAISEAEMGKLTSGLTCRD